MENPFIRKRYDGKPRLFKYGIAAYPTRYKEFMITPNKICMQFDSVVVKGRRLSEPKLDKIEVPNDPDGQDIETLAVGMYIPVYLEVLKQMKEAGVEYLRQGHPITDDQRQELLRLL